MINRLDYFTTTINYTCSPVCLRFSINKVIIGSRSGQGNVIQVTDFPRFCFTEGRTVMQPVSGSCRILQFMIWNVWAQVSGLYQGD